MARPWQRSLDIMPPSRKGSMPEEPPGAELYPTKLSMGEVNPAFHDDTCADATEMQSPVSLDSTSTHCGRADCSSQRSASPFSEKTPWKKRLPFFAKVAVAVLFHAYLAAGISLTWSSTPDYCQDVKFLTVVTAIGYVYVLWCVVCALLGKTGAVCDAYQSLRDRITVTWVKSRLLRPCTWLLVWLCLLSFLVYDSIKDIQRLISLAGIVVLLLIGFIFSNARFRVNWYQVMWGLLLQFLLGLVVLRWSHGRDALQCLANKVKNFLDYTNSGSHFVFGHLASGWNLTEALGDLVPKEDMIQNVTNVTNITTMPIVDTIKSLPAVFMFQALPVIFFFSFFVNILYFYGIMQRLVLIVGSFLQFTIGTTVCESMTAAANIFLGMTEAPLVVRPFLSKMTNSELHTVMTGGFATIAGSVMAAYIHFGVSPAHLMTASIMSAPAALAYSKLLYPETEESQTQRDNIEMPRSEESNVLEAASNGTNVALAMIGSIVANLVGFLAFIAFLNSTLQWFGSIVTLDFLTFEWLLAKIFTPLAFIMGVPWKDCGTVGELIGIKTFANEFIAYSRLAGVIHQLDERSTVIATYALCGFSNLGSIGICIGGLGAIAPDRKSDLARLSFRALAAGSAACFLTACVAGSLIA
ncbi:putative transporter YutK [Rhipicephalus microplus]|uniref:putative transporter YutK n=1 Tax=Rhipicephalus microplus TaxID=6941 RepID=UPI003F6A9EDA